MSVKLIQGKYVQQTVYLSPEAHAALYQYAASKMICRASAGGNAIEMELKKSGYLKGEKDEASNVR